MINHNLIRMLNAIFICEITEEYSTYNVLNLHCIYLDLPRLVASSSKPREEAGMYWGYKVRYASNISSVFKDCPYKVILIDAGLVIDECTSSIDLSQRPTNVIFDHRVAMII